MRVAKARETWRDVEGRSVGRVRKTKTPKQKVEVLSESEHGAWCVVIRMRDAEMLSDRQGACMDWGDTAACAGGASWAKIPSVRCLKGRERARGTVAVPRWCYLGMGGRVWHNLKLEIAVSISLHSTAARSTDNKSSLILLKIPRECSGGWDEEDEEGEWPGRREAKCRHNDTQQWASKL